MKYGSVCSGVEAATVAWHPLGWEPQWFSEIDKFPSAVLAHHYPDVPNYGDMTTFKEWPDDPINLLVGGTPCQSFSVAGLRKGLDDPRGNLMLTYLAIAERYQPRWLVWENVPGVLSSNRGRDFGTFLGALGQIGYGFAYRVLDAQYFGVAQRRRRVFVVGYLGDWRRAAAVLFERESLSGHPAPSREARQDVAQCLTRGVDQRYDPETETLPVTVGSLCARTGRSISSQNAAQGHLLPAAALRGVGFDVAHAIQAGALRENPNSGPDGVGVQSELAYTLEARAEVQAVAHTLRGSGFDASEDGTGRGTPLVPVAFSSNMSVPDCQTDGTTPTVKLGGQGGNPPAVQSGMSVRRLTPRECERLQGFPDDYTLIPYRNKLAADGPRYKAMGNSMAVPVMRWIGERIKMVDSMQ